MVRIADRLNSNIDRLATEIGERPNNLRDTWVPAPASVSEVFETIQVLARTWPGKRSQIEVELRKVLAELGILGRGPAQYRDEPPTSAPEPPKATA